MSKIILITGASSGIGKSISLFLTSKGYKVYGTCRNPNNYDISEYELLKCDITSNIDIKNTINHILNIESRIDVWINNAGIGITGPLEETSESDIKSAFQTNLLGPIAIIKECIPSMRDHNSGLIINITSILGYFGIPFRGDPRRKLVIAFGVFNDGVDGIVNGDAAEQFATAVHHGQGHKVVALHEFHHHFFAFVIHFLNQTNTLHLDSNQVL